MYVGESAGRKLAQEQGGTPLPLFFASIDSSGVSRHPPPVFQYSIAIWRRCCEHRKNPFVWARLPVAKLAPKVNVRSPLQGEQEWLRYQTEQAYSERAGGDDWSKYGKRDSCIYRGGRGKEVFSRQFSVVRQRGRNERLTRMVCANLFERKEKSNPRPALKLRGRGTLRVTASWGIDRNRGVVVFSPAGIGKTSLSPGHPPRMATQQDGSGPRWRYEMGGSASMEVRAW